MYYHPSALRKAIAAPLPALLRSGTVESDAVGAARPEQRWLVPVDGTPESILAVKHVIAHADTARTRVHLLNVQPHIMSGDVSVVASAKLVAHLRRSAGERAVREAKRLLSEHGFEHTCEVVSGSPAEAIVHSAVARGCTKIVMGARRTGALARMMGRAVSSRVIRLSPVTVTIVKSGDGLRGRSSANQERADLESTPCLLPPAVQ